ncbi:MAG: DUF2312 domain-containing protein [Magnetococcus sp. DMHC-6]
MLEVAESSTLSRGKSSNNKSSNRKASTKEGISGEHLEQIIMRIERLEEEKAELAQDVRDLYLEAKSNGFDPKIIRQIVRLRKMEPNDLEEQETLLHVYMRALGMALPSSSSTH